MRQFWVLFRSILLINLRNRTTIFWNVAFPLGLFLLFSTIFSRQDAAPSRVAAWFMAGIIVQNIMASGFGGDASWLTSVRDRGILVRIRTTPLHHGRLIGAYVSVRLLLVLLQSMLLMIVAVLFFDVRMSWAVLPQALVFLVLGGAVFLLLGQAIAAVAPNANAANVIANVFFYPLLFLSDLVIQINSLPEWLQNITRWNPAYMLVALLRPALTTLPTEQDPWISLLGLICYGLLGLVFATTFFRWTPKQA